ncbi:MAG: DUF4430 domain-containing protein [Thermoleophilaceae bacterium]|nr:DUF4430 domain-containing protein [Thermoleophilaceae bacterium]
MAPRRAIGLVAAAVLAAALAGCGVGPGKARSGAVELTVTRDFGQQRLGRPLRVSEVRESDTVMRLLARGHKVTTRYGGGFVQSVDGLSGAGPGGRRDWFYFVNGIEASTGAADRKLHPGDVVQWDYRDWSGAMRVPAIVGAYPEPFVHGENGKRLPVRVECAQPSSDPCMAAQRRLADAGVEVAPADIGVGSGGAVLRVVVGRASEIVDKVTAAALLERGPRASGVFARFDGSGTRLELLDPHGDPVRAAPPGTGLVAATETPGESATWLITGVDDAGVARAVDALERSKLANAFAVAVTPSGLERLPLRAGGGR